MYCSRQEKQTVYITVLRTTDVIKVLEISSLTFQPYFNDPSMTYENEYYVFEVFEAAQTKEQILIIKTLLNQTTKWRETHLSWKKSAASKILDQSKKYNWPKHLVSSNSVSVPKKARKPQKTFQELNLLDLSIQRMYLFV